MRFLRYGPAGQEKPGLLDADGVLRDLSDHIEDLAGEALLPEKLAELGLAEQLIACGLIAPTYQYRDRRSGQSATFDMSCLAGQTAYPYRLQCEQFRLTRAIVAALEN